MRTHVTATGREGEAPAERRRFRPGHWLAVPLVLLLAGQAAEAALFTDSGQTLGNSATFAVALGDVDGEGDLDMVAGNVRGQANRVWINNGVGSFIDSLQALDGVSLDVLLGDLDGDGDLDVVTGSTGKLVWINDGTGAFADSGQVLGTLYTLTMALGDVDCDGDLDIVAGNENGANRVWINDGAGTFTDSGQALGGSNTGGVALGDVDGDGDLDTVTGNSGAANRVYVNDGTGQFADSGQALGNSYTTDVVLGDVDCDGDLDIVAGNYDEANRVWINDGAGTFTDSGQALGGSSTVAVALGDADGDGDLDMVAGNRGQGIRAWINDGIGTFSDLGQTIGSGPTRGIALGDVDGDGDLDVAAGNDDQPNRVWVNNSLLANLPPAAPGGPSAEVTGSDVTFSWNTATDAETPQAGLTYNLRVGTTPGGNEIVSGMAIVGGSEDGSRLVPAMGNVQHNTSWTLKGLAVGKYYWSVQAIDTAFAGSPWATEETVSDLHDLATGEGCVPLSVGQPAGRSGQVFPGLCLLIACLALGRRRSTAVTRP